jgi:benzil reductase ((S)-benzoin forming)
LIGEQLSMALARSLVVLTGPTSGLGLALHDILCEQGVPLLALGRGIDRLSDSAAVLMEADFADTGHGSWIPMLKQQLDHMVDDHPSRVIVFINNAGTIAPIGPATEIAEQRLMQAMQVNFAASLAVAAVIASAAKGRDCRIINVTTGAARRPLPGWLAYCSSKAACRMGLDVLALENPGISVVHVDPGVIDTPMQDYIRQNAGPNVMAPPDRAMLMSPLDAARHLLAAGFGEQA